MINTSLLPMTISKRLHSINLPRLIALTLSILMVLSVITTQVQAAENSSNKEVYATVNGTPIYEEEVQSLLGSITASGASLTEEMIKDIRQRMLIIEALRQEAVKNKVESSEEYRRLLEQAKRQIMVQQHLRMLRGKLTPSSDEINKRYEEMKKNAEGKKEYRVSHILLADLDTANKVLKQLQNQGDFADLAKQYSKDPGSAEKGGDLGWSVPEVYVAEFAQAIKNQKKGKLSTSPVKTQFGYHIIKVEDTRNIPIPSLSEASISITDQIINTNLEKYQDDLLKKSSIKILKK